MEDAADLGTVIINFFKFNSLLLSTFILSITLFGVIAGASALFDMWEVASGDSRFSTRRSSSVSGAITKLILAGACVSFAVIFFQAASTMTLSEDSEAKNVLNYAQQGTISGSYCEKFRHSITLIFMIIGTVAWFNAARQVFRKAGGEMIPWGQPIAYAIGGTLCYFINELARMAAQTSGLKIGLDNMCKTFGGS